MPNPVFILGASRSGTTMLRLMMNAHPAFAVPGEQSYFSSLPVSADAWSEPNLSEAEYEDFVTDYLSRKASTLPGLDVDGVRASILAPEAPRTLRFPYAKTLDSWRETQNKPRWGEKSPTNFFYVDVIDAMFPTARYVHLVRDPRAVVYSMNRFDRCGDDTVMNAANWRTFMDQGAALLEETVPEDRRLTVAYESLVSDPEPNARRICDFLDEPFTPSMLEFYKSADDYMHPVYEKIGGVDTVTRPVGDNEHRPKWETGLSSDQIAVIESICGEGMERYGYSALGLPCSLRARADMVIKLAYVALKTRQHADDRAHLINYRPFGRLYRFREALPLGSNSADYGL